MLVSAQNAAEKQTSQVRTGEKIEQQKSTSANPAAGTYHHVSLKGATDAEIFTFMGRGKTEFHRERELEIKSALPPDFWTKNAKAAALALIEFNRASEHPHKVETKLEDFGTKAEGLTLGGNKVEGLKLGEANRAADQKEKSKVTFDEGDASTPPATCTIAFSQASSRCYFASDSHYFLRVDPKESYLAFARTGCGSVSFYTTLSMLDGVSPRFDLRLCRLPYDEARQIAHVIWWLNRVQIENSNQDVFGGSFEYSTADGKGKLVMKSGKVTEMNHEGSIWAAQLSSRWSGGYDKEVFLNFASYLIAKALPEHIGTEWSRVDPMNQVYEKSTPDSVEEEQKRETELISKFLEWFTLDEQKLSFSIVGAAVNAAGALTMDPTKKRIEEIVADLPLKEPLAIEQISNELNKLGYSSDEKDPAKQKELQQKRHSMEAEMNGAFFDAWADGRGYLQRMLAIARRQFACASDVQKLYEWAISKSEGNQWAFLRVARMDQKRYADALEKLIQQTDGPVARNFFHELTKIDRPRSITVAKNLSDAQKQVLGVSALSLLRDTPEGQDESRWVGEIVEIIHGPKSTQDERVQAIQILVPADKPMRYTDSRIDEALLKVFDANFGDDANFTLTRACHALAMRGRSDLFSRIEEQLSKATNPFVQNGVLAALTHLTQMDPEKLKPRLLTILRPHLTKTNIHLPQIFWSIWAAEIRDLQPELEKLSTQNSSDYEGKKASLVGGTESVVSEQFHLPRHILALWNEPDSLTRAKLLVAVYWTQTGPFMVSDHLERRMALKREMGKAVGELTPNEQTELDEFLKRIENEPPQVGERMHPKTRAEVISFSREAFGM